MKHSMIQTEKQLKYQHCLLIIQANYLAGEDLNLKPSTVEQAKFEYSPLGKIFNKGLSEEDKKEGLFKRLENIKDKNEELINRFSTTNKATKDKANIQSSKKLICDVNHSFAKLRNIDDIINFHLIQCLA